MYRIHYINTNIKCINSTGHLSKARSWYLIKTLILTVVKLKEKEHLNTGPNSPRTGEMSLICKSSLQNVAHRAASRLHGAAHQI